MRDKNDILKDLLNGSLVDDDKEIEFAILEVLTDIRDIMSETEKHQSA